MSARQPPVIVFAFAALSALSLIARPARAQSAASTSIDGIVARVDEIEIRADELDRWWQANDPVEFARVRRELFEGRKRAVDALLADRILESEAARRHVTADQLVADEARAHLTPPTEAAIRELFEKSGPVAISFEEARPIIADYLATQANEAAREKVTQELRDRRASRTTITLADPALDAKATTGDRSIGATGAPVEVVEFADFQCPFCGELEPVMKRLLATFGERVRFVWKDFPLSSIHEHALAAAVAARCAAEQGAFWRYHDLLFNNQEALALDDLRKYARDVSLDVARFDRCMTEPAAASDVQSDLEEGTLRGVEGTPTVFINGEQLSGALDYDDYERVIVRELTKSSSQP